MQVIPLSLEDSCLAWLVNDLEHYPPEVLALLPLRLRYRLLANVPVLDLCQLEHTSVAAGVDLESIWELKCTPWEYWGAAVKHVTTTRDFYIDISSLSWRDRYLHTVANSVLNNIVSFQQACFYRYERQFCLFEVRDYYTVVVEWLISLRGHQFLNEGGDSWSGYDWQNLANPFLFFETEHGKKYDLLTLHRYAPYKSCSTRLSDEELITLLLRNCHFKPKYLLVPTKDGPFFSVSKLLLQKQPCDILKEFLNNLEEVQLVAPETCPDLPVILFRSMFSGVSPCKLRTLQVLLLPQFTSKQEKEEFQKSMMQIIADMITQQCFIENIYLHFPPPGHDVLRSGEFTLVVAALTSFVTCSQFRTLDIHNFYIPADAVVGILCAFLLSPCSHQQVLKTPLKTIEPSPSSGQLHPVTSYPVRAVPVLLVPDSGLDYKELYLYQRVHVDELNVEVFKTVFAFPIK